MVNQKNDQLQIGYYLVAFIDLLGQRDKLKKIKSIPHDENGAEYSEFIELLKDTIGAVDSLQSSVYNFFDAYTKTPENIPKNTLPSIRKSIKTEIKFQHFSDGLVIYVPLRVDQGYSPASSVYGALCACGSLCLLQLAKKFPVRIGISIGIATELRDNEIYGPAVVEAYELEAYVAQYPRVVVSDSLINYLLGYASMQSDENDLAGKITKQLSKTCLEMVGKDFDGRAIVNYMGDFFRENITGKDDNSLHEDAKEFITQQLKLHQENQNSKLAFRYALLHGYFHEHYK